MLPATIPSLGLSAAGGAAAGYRIARSLRFRGGAYLKRTFTVIGNRQKYTWAGWVKPPIDVSDFRPIFCNGNATAAGVVTVLRWEASPNANQLFFGSYGSGAVDEGSYRTVGLFRDPAAWYHVVAAIDTTAAAGLRFKLWVNGVGAGTITTTEMALNYSTFINYTFEHDIGSTLWNGSYLSGYYLGYLAENYFIDGQALDPSSFGQFDPVTGVWGPKAYTGTYGTNGFHLDFADNSNVTTTTLGKDTSGNGNNYTPANFSIAADHSNDSLLDTPTNYADSGGVLHGNYCTLNAAKSSAPMYWGNLAVSSAEDVWRGSAGTIGVDAAADFYFESYIGQTTNSIIGIATANANVNTDYQSNLENWVVHSGGTKFGPGVTAAPYMGAWGNTNVMGVRINAGTLTFYLNGVSQGPAFTGITGTVFPWIAVHGVGGSQQYTNFGQQPFRYAAPAGSKALCTQNLPDPVIKLPKQYMDIRLRTGAGTGGSVTDLGFQPDFIWSKARNVAASNLWYDSVRGPANALYSDLTNAEDTSNLGQLAFLSNGYSYGSTTAWDGVGRTLVEWLWKKGALPGVDVVAFTASNSRVPHALGVKPAMIIAKARNAPGNGWEVTHKDFGAIMGDYYANLHNPNAVVLSNGIWLNEPTATDFTAPNTIMGGTGLSCIAYLFAAVPGFSTFGKYVGNGSADGPFVWCGFRPRWIMSKRADAVGSWVISDTARDPFNVVSNYLLAEASGAENSIGGGPSFDMLANGFKPRTAGANINAAGGLYIFAAFAEAPFKYARAR
jgi:hypothetical protein